jgi:large repetitive protein
MGSSLRRSHRAWLLRGVGVLASCLAAGLVTAGVVSGTSAIASLTTESEPNEVTQSAAPAVRCAPAGEDSVWVDKSSYARGAAVSIDGSGFAPDCVVGVRIAAPDGSTSVQDVTTAADGSLDAWYSMPNPAIPGEYVLVALGESDGVLASARFQGRAPAGDGPTVWTNKNDYMPGEMVVMLGSGWEPGETVDLRLNGTPVLHGERSFTTVADALGDLEFTGFRPDELDIGVSFSLRATGQSSGRVAETTFTDAITFAASTPNHNGDPAAPELSLQVPATTAAGDLLLAHVTVEGMSMSHVICTPTGWTSIFRTNNSSSLAQQIFRKLATASEPTSYTFRLRETSANCTSTSSGLVVKGAVGGMTAFTGVDTAVTNGIFGQAGTSGSSSTINSPSVGSVPVNSGVVRFFGNDKEFEITTSGGGSSQMYAARRAKSGGGFEKPSGGGAFGTQAPAGSTAAVTGANGNNSGNWVAQTVVLRVSANSAPSGTDKTIAIAEDGSHTFAASDFGFVDSGDTMNGVRIDTLPAAGTLKLSGTNVTAAQLIPQASIPNLVFAPAANASGSPYASFTFSVRDTNGPIFDPTPNTITVNVTPVDDAPVAVDDLKTVAEDSGATTIAVLANDTDIDAGPKTIASITQPPNGSVAVAGDNLSLTYRPNANYCNGGTPTDNFTYKLNGGSEADVFVTVDCANDAPVCEDVELTTDEDNPGSEPADCIDVDGNPLTYVAGPAATGTSGVDGDDLTFNPATAFQHLDDGVEGSDAFTYRANDGTTLSAPANVDVTITGANDAPVCDPASITTTENAVGSTPAACSDVDGDSLEYSVTEASTGDSAVAGTDLTYDPAGAFEGLDDGEDGTDAFQYTARDGDVESAPAGVDVTITGVNDAPECEAVAISVSENGPAGSTAPDCSDVDDVTLTYAVTGATGGGLSGLATGPLLTYDPDGAFESLDDTETASDPFTYTASDGTDDSNQANVNVTVNGANDAPVCEDVELTADEDNPGSEPADCTDVDGETLTYFAGLASNGGVSGVQDDNLTYDPLNAFQHLDDEETDSDSFAYTASDGTDDSNQANVNVTVNGANDAPVCEDVELTADEDNPGSEPADCTDVDGETLTYFAGLASNGGVSGVQDDNLTYDPAGAFEYLGDTQAGSDSFAYTASDGTADSNEANVDVTITGVNDTPECLDRAITTDEDTPGSVAASCTDAEGDQLTYDVGPASTGQSGHDNDDLTYDPLSAFQHLDDEETDSDSFAYTAHDGLAESLPANVAVAIDGLNDAPVCENVELATDENSPGSQPADCADVDGEPLIYTVTAAAYGASDHSGDDLTYDPSGQFEHLGDGDEGTDAFTYKAFDGDAHSNDADVNVTVTGVNDAPACEDVVMATDEDSGTSEPAACSDAEGDDLTYDVTAATAGGLSGVADDDLTYDPNGAFEALGDATVAADGFTYTANDGALDSDEADVDVTITGVNDAPVCANVAISTDEDTPGETPASCTDAEGDTLEYSAGPAGTGISGEDGDDLTYDPDDKFEHLGGTEHANDAFTYTAHDGDISSALANVAVTITGVNDAPECLDREITTDEDTQGSVAASCTDVEDDLLTYDVGPASTGQSGHDDDELTYDPLDAFQHLDDTETESDSFSYTAHDGDLPSAGANVAVTVTGVNDAPVCLDREITTDEDNPGQTPTACTDAEGDLLEYSITSASPGTAGLTAENLTYNPAGAFESLGTGDSANDSFTYAADDGDAQSLAAIVSVTITGVNDAPTVVLTGPAAANENSTKTFSIDTTDPDSSSFTLGVHDCGESGDVVAGSLVFDTGTGDGSFRCSFPDDDPTATVADVTTVGVTVSDGESAPAGDSLDVTVANLAPLAVIASPGAGGTYPVGMPVTVTAPFTDAGLADAHSCTINGVAATVSYDGPGDGTCSGSVTPATSGGFPVTVVVRDDDYGSSTAVVTINALYAVYANEKCSGGSGKGLSVNGAENDVDGGMHSNGSFKVDGTNFQSGTVTLYRPQSGCTTSYNASRVNFGSPSPTAPLSTTLKSWPWNPTKSEFTCTYSQAEFVFNKTGQTIAPGVYCASKLFKINASNVSGNVTIIAPEIAVNGKNISLIAYAKNVLMLGTGTKEIILDGDLTPDTEAAITGLIHNPNGGLKVNGNRITLWRSYLQAQWVEINLKGFKMRF